jgi:hypothetical protein
MYSTRSTSTFRAKSTDNISKISTAGITMSGKALTGKLLSLLACHLVLSNESKPPSKTIHGWLNTGHQKSKISPEAVDSHKCPLFQESNETQELILMCPADDCTHKKFYDLVHLMLCQIMSNPLCPVQ